ncbi:protoporphyrinogen oxidase [Nocardioidaceae bacterium]|nr:protoporphyrinogen oxidase [Nocardioidaceae bacterium]
MAVVGGGIAGLSAARRLLLGRPDLDVVVLDAADRVGGKLRLAEVGGVEVDVGAESLLFRRPEAVDLAREVGLGDDLEHPATYAARVWSRGARRPLPRSVMGVPGDQASLEESGLLSAEGLRRALAEPDLPETDVERLIAAGEDVGVGELVAARFGDEVVDRLLEPLLGGVYAGEARRLSLRACTPQVLALTDQGTSLTAAAASVLAAPASQVPVFAGLRGGVGRLPAALAADLQRRGATVRTGVTVREVTRTPSGFRLTTGPAPAPEHLDVDAVVLATPATPSSRLLAHLLPSAAGALGGIAYASSAVVTFALEAGSDGADVPLEGSGFLVPPVEGRLVKAATFSRRKWSWVHEAGATADRPVALIRVSVGRVGEEHHLQVDDEQLVRRCLVDLTAALGAPLPAVVDARVTRWGGGLPQYAPGHLDLVASVRDQVAGVAGLAVCGAAYDGVGVPACIASGTRAAEALLADAAQWAT